MRDPEEFRLQCLQLAISFPRGEADSVGEILDAAKKYANFVLPPETVPDKKAD